MLKDEQSWAQEYADIPVLEERPSVSKSIVIASHKSMPTFRRHLENMTDFSVAMCADDEGSLGGYFSRHNPDLSEMLPNRSPPKHAPLALINPVDCGES